MKTNRYQIITQQGLGLLSSLAFFFGSMMFLPNFTEHATIGVWLFMAGSALMFIDVLLGVITPRRNLT